MAELKIGRDVFDVNDRDVVLFNGACWQLISRRIKSGWSSYCPKMSKTLSEKLLRKGVLYLVKKEGEYTTTEGKQMGLCYYKFDMDKLVEFLRS